MESHDPITVGQIGKIQELIGAALRKSGLQNNPVQQVIERQGAQVIGDIIAVIRKYVEAIGDMIVRHATVNRTRSPRDAIAATGRSQYVDKDVIAMMPRGDGDESDVIFFKPGRHVSDVDLDKEYALRGLVPADPYALAAVNEADPTFADEHPNGTHWKDADGKWCYTAFGRWGDERRVDVGRHVGGWDDGWWFAGLRK